MFWMRLRKGNSSRRVRRYWALILHVKHFGFPVHQLANSQVNRLQQTPFRDAVAPVHRGEALTGADHPAGRNCRFSDI